VHSLHPNWEKTYNSKFGTIHSKEACATFTQPYSKDEFEITNIIPLMNTFSFRKLASKNDEATFNGNQRISIASLNASAD